MGVKVSPSQGGAEAHGARRGAAQPAVPVLWEPQFPGAPSRQLSTKPREGFGAGRRTRAPRSSLGVGKRSRIRNPEGKRSFLRAPDLW